MAVPVEPEGRGYDKLYEEFDSPLQQKLRREAYGEDIGHNSWVPNPQGFLFVTRNNRPPSSNKVVEYHLWPILDALEIPRCGVHAFRHTHTALLLDSGATPKVVQRQLRHSDARTTLEIYGHVVGDAHRAAVEKVASIVDPSGPQSGRRDKWIQ
jgi:integrase